MKHADPMFDFSKDPRKLLLTMLKEPITSEDPEGCFAEMVKRLERARLHDPIVSSVYMSREHQMWKGDYRITREMVYAALAYHLLQSKVQWEDMAMRIAMSSPAPIIIQKDPTGA